MPKFLLIALFIPIAGLQAATIVSGDIPETKLQLRVFGEAIRAPSDSFQTMHSGLLAVPGEGIYAYGTPLTSAGDDVEQLSVWILDDRVDIMSDDVLDRDIWHTPGLPGGDTLINPLAPDSLFDVADDGLFNWADSCLCGYTSDPFMFLDGNGVKSFLVRASRICYEKAGGTQWVNFIYLVKWAAPDQIDTATVINGYFNTGTSIQPVHGSLNLLAPSVVVDSNLYHIFTVEDTGSGRTMALWETPDPATDTAIPTPWVSRRKLRGNLPAEHHDLAVVQWALPEPNQHWHTTIHAPAPGRYEGFATGSLLDDQPVYFGTSSDGEHWTTYPEPLIPASGERPGTPIIDSSVYTVRPFIVGLGDTSHYRLVVSGARDTGDSYHWYSTIVAMRVVDPQTPSAPTTLSPVSDPCPVDDLRPVFVWSESADPNPGDVVRYRLHLATSESFDPEWVSPTTGDTTMAFSDSLMLSMTYWWKVTAEDTAGHARGSAVASFRTWLAGDVDGGGAVNVADLTLLIAYLFRGGSMPCSLVPADVNADCAVSVADLTRLIAFLFRGGPPPEQTACE